MPVKEINIEIILLGIQKCKKLGLIKKCKH